MWRGQQNELSMEATSGQTSGLSGNLAVPRFRPRTKGGLELPADLDAAGRLRQMGRSTLARSGVRNPDPGHAPGSRFRLRRWVTHAAERGVCDLIANCSLG